jgi:hypothetical protein
MSQPRVLLLTLFERTSTKGRRYLSGWLGKASVVAFEGKADEQGRTVWEVFVSTPEPRTSEGEKAKEHGKLERKPESLLGRR